MAEDDADVLTQAIQAHPKLTLQQQLLQSQVDHPEWNATEQLAHFATFTDIELIAEVFKINALKMVGDWMTENRAQVQTLLAEKVRRERLAKELEDLTPTQKSHLERRAEEIARDVRIMVGTRFNAAWGQFSTDMQGTEGDKRNFKRLLQAAIIDQLGKIGE